MDTRERLITEHYPFARNIGRRLAWWDRDEGEGIAGEALVEAVDRFLDGRTPVGELRSLVYLVVHGRVTDQARRSFGRDGRRLHVARPDPLEATPRPDVLPPLDSLAAPEGGYGAAELALDLLPFMDLLNDQERDLIARRVAGQDLATIGAAWGRTESRASQVWKAAREKLAPAIGASFLVGKGLSPPA